MKKSLSFILLMVGVPFLIVMAEPSSGEGSAGQYRVQRGLVYSDTSDFGKLDLFLSEPTGTATPCVIVIQGRGFRAQAGQKFIPFAKYLAQHGIAAALIGYRGQPEHTYQATVSDAKKAVLFVRQHSAKYHLNPNKVGAMGRSAGATIVALLAMAEDNEFNDSNATSSQSSDRIPAAVGIAGGYDFVARFESEEQRLLQPNLEAKVLSNNARIGTPFAPTDQHWRSASAITHLDRSDPPMLLRHARDDKTVPWPQSREMHRALNAAGVTSELHLSETSGHGGPTESKERRVVLFQRAFDA